MSITERIVALERRFYDWFRLKRLYGVMVYLHGLRSGAVQAACPLPDKSKLDIVTISFNSPTVIRHQIRLLRKNLCDPFYYTVFDNSPDPAAQKEIAEICRENGVDYFTLPVWGRLKWRNPSDSHGMALNWVYRLFIKKRGADYFGFLDHDIFPIRPTSILPDLKSRGAYGPLKVFGERWYIWAGRCFFSRSFIGDRKPDFMPVTGLDTGGGNYQRLFARYERSAFESEEEKLRRENDVGVAGDWLHISAASNWNGENRGEGDWADKMLSEY